MARRRRKGKRAESAVAPNPPRRLTDRPLVILTIATIAALLPFIGKAFTIDDPLFVWAAQHITIAPADPYGFDLNWVGRVRPMSDVMENPPLTSYFIALASVFTGWNAAGLHVAFLLPAVAAIIATWFLAQSLCESPVLAAIIVLLSPGFLTSATNVMSDIPMLACFTAAIAMWIRGGENRPALLWIAAATGAVATLFKYFGAASLLLMAAYALVKRMPIKRWLPPLIAAIAVILLYDYVTKLAYGHGLFMTAAEYATTEKTQATASLVAKGVLAVEFGGGCCLGVLFFLPLLKRKIRWGAVIAALIAVAMALATRTQLGLRDPLATAQFMIFVACGMLVLCVGIADVVEHRTADSALLLLWIGGTLFFAAYVNWTANMRSVLPMVPAAAILIVRSIEVVTVRRVAIPLAATAAVAFLVATADERFANAQRAAATLIKQKYAGDPHRLWFEGHWGFQYYMERLGGSAFDLNQTLHGADLLITPSTNTLLMPYRPPNRIIEQIKVPIGLPAATISYALHAGFYSDFVGRLPYSLGVIPPEETFVVRRLGRR